MTPPGAVAPPASDAAVTEGVPAERTKTRLLELLKRHGPQTAQDLAGRLAVTTPAARRHLQDLQEQGLIEASTERPGGRGRPQHVFSLSDHGEHVTFPKNYSSLCVEVLGHVRELFGDAAVRQVMDARNARLAAQLAPELPPELPLPERAQRLAVRLSELGFDPALECEGGQWFLVQRNCPNLQVAREFGDICASELQLYAELLAVPVVRESRIVCGQGSCRYRVG